MMFYYDEDRNVYPTHARAIASNRQCFFYFHDDVFSKVDWKTEPTETLDVLYRERAQQIRDQYDHVILCYSGGYDSTNILEAFYYNNIHIDEILLVGAFSQDKQKGTDENHNGDIYLNAFPTLNGMNLPNTKITVADYTEHFTDPNNFTLIKKYGNEWTDHIGAFKSVHNLFWYDLKKFIGRDNNKKTCYIMGSDKPGYDALDKCVRFNDLSVNDYGANYEDENFKRINFYNGTDDIVIKIMVKQAHVVMRCETMFVELVMQGKSLPHGWQREVAYMDRMKRMNSIIYNLRTPLQFESTKSMYSSLSARDMFMLSKTDSAMYRMTLEGMRTISKHTTVNRKHCFFSQPYYLK
jgi:hypothetical protein